MGGFNEMFLCGAGGGMMADLGADAGLGGLRR
jgi:hypothetical protein